VVAEHGAITDIKPPSKKKEGDGIAPSKECPKCYEIIASQKRVCPECGFEFPLPQKKPLYLRTDDIIGVEPSEMVVNTWKVENHTGAKTGRKCLKITYYPVFGLPIEEYVFHKIKMVKPHLIKYRKNGKFFKVIDRIYVDNSAMTG
jgi:hypothetical protein